MAENPTDICTALQQFQQRRIASSTREVLFSRHLGRLKQSLDDEHDWFAALDDLCKELGQANMATFPM